MTSMYHPAPKSLAGFPGLFPVKWKTPMRGGGGMRRRWKDERGNIYEWDYRHGTVEMYDPRGRHLGEFDPVNGQKLKAAQPGRRVEP